MIRERFPPAQALPGIDPGSVLFFPACRILRLSYGGFIVGSSRGRSAAQLNSSRVRTCRPLLMIRTRLHVREETE